MSMRVMTGNELGMKLIEALGIDKSRHVKRITLVMDANNMATVEIVEAVTEGGAAGLVEVVSNYELVEKKADGSS